VSGALKIYFAFIALGDKNVSGGFFYENVSRETIEQKPNKKYGAFQKGYFLRAAKIMKSIIN